MTLLTPRLAPQPEKKHKKKRASTPMWVFTSVNRMLVSVLSTTCAMAGFSVALIAGLAAENTVEAILERSLISLGACYLGGYVIGYVLDGVNQEHAQKLRDSEAATAGSSESSLDSLENESQDQPAGMGTTA